MKPWHRGDYLTTLGFRLVGYSPTDVTRASKLRGEGKFCKALWPSLVIASCFLRFGRPTGRFSERNSPRGRRIQILGRWS